jgi:hypothetical protein
MTPISTSSTSYSATQPTSSTNSVASARDLQKQIQEQQQQTRDQLKPVAEQVYISNQAQQLLDIYATSTANANDAYSTDTTSSSTSTNTAQVLDSVNTVQNRQTALALAEYKQQQPVEEPTVKPKPEQLPSASTSINFSA